MASNGKTAIVTGANKGIGLAIANKLAEEGYNIAACLRSSSTGIHDLVNNPQFDGQEHQIFKIDLLDKSSIYKCVKSIFMWKKSADILVNNAGIAHGSLYMMTRSEDFHEVFEANFFSQIYLSQLVSKRMLRTKSSSIINISSTAGILADKGTLAYGCSKAALIHATKIMATELGVYGIRVNSIAPSITETDMSKLMDKDSINRLDQRTALSGRIQPVEVANVVSFLISDNAKNITGQIIRIDQGISF